MHTLISENEIGTGQEERKGKYGEQIGNLNHISELRKGTADQEEKETENGIRAAGMHAYPAQGLQQVFHRISSVTFHSKDTIFCGEKQAVWQRLRRKGSIGHVFIQNTDA